VQELMTLKRQGEQLLSRYGRNEMEMRQMWSGQFQRQRVAERERGTRDRGRESMARRQPGQGSGQRTGSVTPTGQGPAPTGSMKQDIQEATEASMDMVKQEIDTARGQMQSMYRQIVGGMQSDASKVIEQQLSGIDAEYERAAQEIIANSKGNSANTNAQLAQLRNAALSQKYTLSQNTATDFVQQRTAIGATFAQLAQSISNQAIGTVGQLGNTSLTSQSFATQTQAKIASTMQMFGQELAQSYQKLALNKEVAKQSNALAWAQLQAAGWSNTANWFSQYVPEAPVYGQIASMLARAQMAQEMA